MTQSRAVRHEPTKAVIMAFTLPNCCSKKIRFLDEIDQNEFGQIMGDRPALFVGSGISTWAPSSLPAGRAITDGIFAALFYNNTEFSEEIPDQTLLTLKPWFSEFPFERIMERCPDQPTLRVVMRSLFNVSTPNLIHRLITDSLVSGKCDSAVTTNYDCCLDQALAFSRGVNAYEDFERGVRVVLKGDYVPEAPPVLFKVHGSIESDASLVFTLRHESVLLDWKRDILKRLWANRTLVVVGFSGTDFEICPEIAKTIQPQRVIWNFFSEADIRANACNVMCESDGIIVLGDMRPFLSKMIGPVTASQGNSINVAELIRAHFNQSCRDLWKLRVLTSMTCGGPAVLVSDSLENREGWEDLTSVNFLKEKARAYYFSGAHKKAALTFARAGVLATRLGESDYEIGDLYLAECDAWRSYGAFRHARRTLNAARRVAQDSLSVELKAGVELKRLAMLRQIYRLSRRLKLGFMANRIRKTAESILRPLAEPLSDEGAWIGYFQLRAWTERFDLQSTITSTRAGFEAPVASEGYSRLGDLMGQMIALRDQFRKQKVCSEEAITQAEMFARNAEELGIKAEAWKLRFLVVLTVARIAPWRQRTRVTENFGKFIKDFADCEYGAPRRVTVLLSQL